MYARMWNILLINGYTQILFDNYTFTFLDVFLETVKGKYKKFRGGEFEVIS